MKHRPLILHGKVRGVQKRLLPALVPSHFRQKIRSLHLKNILYQCINIRVIIVKGIAVHRAGLRNILNGDLINGALVEQPDKRPPDGIFCFLRHVFPPIFLFYIPSVDKGKYALIN